MALQFPQDILFSSRKEFKRPNISIPVVYVLVEICIKEDPPTMCFRPDT